MKHKHRNDKNHGKDGWVGGNPRYRRRRRKTNRKDRTMAGLKKS